MNAEERSIAERIRFDARANGRPGATSLAHSRSNRPTTCCEATRLARSLSECLTLATHAHQLATPPPHHPLLLGAPP